MYLSLTNASEKKIRFRSNSVRNSLFESRFNISPMKTGITKDMTSPENLKRTNTTVPSPVSAHSSQNSLFILCFFLLVFVFFGIYKLNYRWFVPDIEYRKQFNLHAVFNLSADSLSVIDWYARFTASTVTGMHFIVLSNRSIPLIRFGVSFLW